jgi:NitT/TauT family transport system substrate-binding protein
VLVETDVMEQTPGVLIFTDEALREKRAAIGALYRAYDRAVSDLNARSDELRPAIVRLGEFPPTVQESMVIPRYDTARRPSAAELGDVIDWMMLKGLIEERPDYDEIIAGPGLY